jgi:hypothetical protein
MALPYVVLLEPRSVSMDLAFGSEESLPSLPVQNLPLLPIGIGIAVALLSKRPIVTAGLLYLFYRYSGKE